MLCVWWCWCSRFSSGFLFAACFFTHTPPPCRFFLFLSIILAALMMSVFFSGYARAPLNFTIRWSNTNSLKIFILSSKMWKCCEYRAWPHRCMMMLMRGQPNLLYWFGYWLALFRYHKIGLFPFTYCTTVISQTCIKTCMSDTLLLTHLNTHITHWWWWGRIFD